MISFKVQEHANKNRFFTWCNSTNGGWILGGLLAISSIPNSIVGGFLSGIVSIISALFLLPISRVYTHKTTGIILSPTIRWIVIFLSFIITSELKQTAKEEEQLRVETRIHEEELHQKKLALEKITAEFSKNKVEILKSLQQAISNKDISSAEKTIEQYKEINDSDFKKLVDQLNILKSTKKPDTTQKIVYTPTKLRSMISSGKYPKQGSVSITTKQVDFDTCVTTINQLLSAISPDYPVEKIVSTENFQTQKAWTNDSAMTFTCKGSESKLIVTTAPYIK